jgi:glycosyltransferase involved in cell wall biosynthesis
MTDLLILCPTRGRPAAAKEAHESFLDTKVREGSEIMFVVDDDDPTRVEYEGERFLHLTQPSPGNMVAALNDAALWAIERWDPKYIGFIGDDHRFRTPGWDRAFTDLLAGRGGGFVYGNDLFWPNGEIPTQIVMSASIISALGWMGLPGCTHLFIDNAWRHLGEATRSLYYMPDVVIEHMHPAGGKADWDEGHLRVNTPEMYGHDGRVFEAWVNSGAPEDVERVRSALGRAPA